MRGILGGQKHLLRKVRAKQFFFSGAAVLVWLRSRLRSLRKYGLKHSALLRRWDSWQYRPYMHRVGGVLLLVGFVSVLVRTGLFAAPDLNDDWDLSVPGDYSYSNGIEVTSGVAQLKAQNYTSDGNTAALYHFDESGGGTASDSSSHSNDATLHGGSFALGNLNNGISLDGVSDFLTVPNNSSLQLGQEQTIEAWTKFNSTFNSTDEDRRYAIADKGDYQLYYDNETGKLTYELANGNSTTWTQVNGNDTNGGWGTTGKRSVSSSVVMNSNVYVGIGNQTADAEVWRWNGSAWAQIGGDGINSSWSDQTFEDVNSLTTDGTHIYAGLGTGAGDAEVWMWDGSTWTKIGGDAINSSWAVNTFEIVPSLTYYNSRLYAGLGSGANDAEVWSWNGSSWTKIGGDSLNGGWTTNYEMVASLSNDGTNLYAGLGVSAGDGEVWRWNGTSWTKIGGDSINSGWGSNIETVRSLMYVGSTLYAGLGDSSDDASVWSWNGSAWTQVGGDGIAGSWDVSYEAVYSLGTDGTHLYAGLGSGNGDGEVWELNGGSWSQVGGDGNNSSWASAFGDSVYTISNDGSTVYAGTYDTAGGGWLYSWNGASWTELGGQYVNKSWGAYGRGSVEVMQVAGNYLYAGTGGTASAAQVWQYDGALWQIVGGQGINNSWAANTYERISSMSSHEGNLYVGLGTTANDGEVWMWDGSTWTQIGGDSLHNGWAAGFEEVNALSSFNGDLYAGLGNSNNDAEVWRWDGANWTKIGGDSLNSGWTTNYNLVSAMTVFKGDLYAGLGANTGEAELWKWDGSGWSKVGGDAVDSSWADATYEQVESMVQYDNKLYVGLGNGTGDAELWQFDGTSTWNMIGGDGINSSWDDGTYERVRTLATYNGDLYVGLGSSTGDGEVWQWKEGAWTKLGGNSLNGSWANTMEEVESFSAYQGKLYAGTGNSTNTDPTIWSYGNNGFLQSSSNTFASGWHHVAATYDGATMKLYIDGSLDSSTTKTVAVPSSTRELLIGAGYGGREYGKPQARFEGMLDELRISTVARSSFTTSPYPTTRQTISPVDSVRTSGVWHWDSLTPTQTPSGGTITFRLSNDDGASWLYWDGGAWAPSNDPSLSNTSAVITSHFSTFPVTFSGLKWQAVLQGDGTQQVGLDGVSADATSDTTAPTANPAAIGAYKANGGSVLSPGSWTNGASPYFTWGAGSDADAGVYGYCAYLGTDNSADPQTTKGLLGTSPLQTGGHCQFIAPTNTFDLATAGYLGTALSSSNDTIYLLLRTIDKAGNVTNSSSQFGFRFDNTPPSNPGFITAPSGFINTKDVDMTWPTTGASAPSDDNSGIAGLQYRIGSSGQWYGDSHSGTGDMTDLLANDGSYTTVDPTDYDALNEGINTVYFRTWDNAGNYTNSYTTATLKINTTGAPSEPTNLTASPSSNTSNSFGFDWDPPVTYIGDVSNITYCYTVNTVPSAGSCSYTAAGSRVLTVGPYATQPGVNTLYVAARDESSNINYSNYASVDFTANTTAPGIPLNTDIVDVSIKNTSNWRLALTWDEPSTVGEGVQNYRVFRSTNNTTFTQVGSSSSTTYIDAGLGQQTYYYKVAACDSTQNCGAYGSVVSEYPTGKFTTAASLVSGPLVSGVTTKRATIRWSTDRGSDSKISIGTRSGQYSASEVGNSNQVSAHEIKLDNLSPGTTYYFKSKWTDEDGNTGTSQEKTFTTSPAPTIKEVSSTGVGLSGATVRFTVKGATKAKVYYGPSESFGGLKQVNTSTSESTYEVQLSNLSDGTKYYYMVSAIDAEGSEYRGNIASFTTPPSPKISNLRFQPVAGEPTSTQSVTWETNVPSTSQVSYTLLNGTPIELQTSILVTSHEMVIRNLQDDSEYSLVAQSRDSSGNLATSDRQTFRTALDTRPPKVSNVVVESSIRGSGSEARGQIVVSWQTDEPATSQVAYSEGSDATTFNSRTAEDTRLVTEHIVIISDLPTSRVFSIQPVSNDKAKNEGHGETQTAIIGRASDSAITIIFNTLRSIFGL